MHRGFAEKRGIGQRLEKSCGDSARRWALAEIRDDDRNDASGLACCGYSYAEFLELGAGGAFFLSAWIAAYDFA